MNRNMGLADRIIRIMGAVAIVILFFGNQISGTAAIVLAVLATIFAATGIISVCPLYLPFGISTRKKS